MQSVFIKTQLFADVNYYNAQIINYKRFVSPGEFHHIVKVVAYLEFWFWSIIQLKTTFKKTTLINAITFFFIRSFKRKEQLAKFH